MFLDTSFNSGIVFTDASLDYVFLAFHIYIYCRFKDLFIWRAELERGEERIFHPLIHSSNVGNHQGWAS